MILRYPDPAHAKPSAPVLRVEVVDGGDRTVTVAVSGEVDIATVQLLDAGIQHGLRGKPAQLVVHLAGVSFFGAAGLHALLTARAQAAELVLSTPSSPVLTALKLAQARELFKIEREPAAGVAK